MGQVISMISSVWESFTLPYKAAIVASFIFWLRIQRNRIPGFIIYAVFHLVWTILKRLVGIKMHPRWGIPSEFIVGTLRYALDEGEPDQLMAFFNLFSAITPKKNRSSVIKASGFNAVWYGEPDPNEKVLLYIHGGAYIFGNSLSYSAAFDILLEKLKENGIKCAILSVDYSLSPAAPFLTAISQCVAAYDYLLKNLSISPNRIIVAGDSAGGALSLALAYQIRESLPPPAGLLLISPWVDSRNPDRYKLSPNLKYDFLTPKLLKKGVEAYLQNHKQNHLSSPCMGNTEGFPKMLVVVGGKEIFRNDIQDFAQKVARENGADNVEVYEDPDMIHDFVVLPDFFGTNALVALQKSADFMASMYRLAD